MMLRKFAQRFARQLSGLVARETRYEQQRARQKHRIDAGPQGLLDIVFGFTRRYHKCDESREGSFVGIRQEKDAVLDTLELQQRLVEISDGGSVTRDVHLVLSPSQHMKCPLRAD